MSEQLGDFLADLANATSSHGVSLPEGTAPGEGRALRRTRPLGGRDRSIYRRELTYQPRLIYRRGVIASPADEAPLQFLQLVADPLRWQLLGQLAQSDRRVGEL